MDVREDRATAIARALFETFLERRPEDAEVLISDDFTFTSPYDDAIDRATYFARCWPNGDCFLNFRIERTAEDADGVFVTYACNLKNGNLLRNTYHLHLMTPKFGAVRVQVYAYGTRYVARFGARHSVARVVVIIERRLIQFHSFHRILGNAARRLLDNTVDFPA